MLSNNEWVACLREAQRLYNGSRYMTKQQRYDAVVSLAEYEVFSTSQLSQISGVSQSTLRGWGLKKGKFNGKFNPMSLDTLIAIRLNSNTGVESPSTLLNAAVREGNSLRVVSAFTGVSRTTIQRKVTALANSSSGV